MRIQTMVLLVSLIAAVGCRQGGSSEQAALKLADKALSFKREKYFAIVIPKGCMQVVPSVETRKAARQKLVTSLSLSCENERCPRFISVTHPTVLPNINSQDLQYFRLQSSGLEELFLSPKTFSNTDKVYEPEQYFDREKELILYWGLSISAHSPVSTIDSELVTPEGVFKDIFAWFDSNCGEV